MGRESGHARAFGATTILVSLGLAAVCCAGQGPIHLVFDMHVDPVGNGLPTQAKWDFYNLQVSNINWVLDQTEPLGVEISFLSSGQWAEMVTQEGPGGQGAACLQRIYANGGQIGTHNHSEYRIGTLNWGQYPQSDPNPDHSRRVWQDNIAAVNEAIRTALGIETDEELAAVNSVRGTHMPADGSLYHQLMAEFGFQVRQGGAEEDYYQWYGHHIWNPFRPAVENYMAEDINTPFVVPPQGAVIGVAGIHHGVFQDMSAPAVKRQFLQLLLNWRYAERTGAAEKVWCWGWGSHSQDFNVGSASRRDMVDVIQWLDEHFAHRTTALGEDVMTWATQADVAKAYVAWETSHPGQSSFSFESLQVDCAEYPYLRPVAEYLKDHLWQADLDLGPAVEAYQLAKDGTAVVVAWTEAGDAQIDVASIIGPKVKVVGLETGTVYQTEGDASGISIGVEPVFITAGTEESEDADNLLVNSGFEQSDSSGLVGWTPVVLSGGAGTVQLTLDTAKSHTGAACARIEIAGAQRAIWSQVVDVTPGTVYTLGGYVAFEGLHDGGLCRLEVVFRDAGNKIIQHVNLPDHTGTRGFELDYPASLKFRAPAGAVQAEVNGFVQGPGTAWFDDVCFAAAPLGRVGGTITSDGDPLEGVQVWIHGAPWGQAYEAVTDSYGQYLIEGLPVAFSRYIVLASKDGYKTRPVGDIAVVKGQATIVDVEMTPGEDPADDLQVRFGSLELALAEEPAAVPTDAVIPADASGYPASVREYLKVDACITADDPEVVALAEQIVADVDPDDRNNTYEVAWTVYEWICRNVNHDAVFGNDQPYEDITSGIWQTIQQGGWSWGRNFYDWAYRPAELIQTRCGICVEHSWLACALLRALNIPARAIIGSAQFWVQKPGAYGYWVGLSASGGSNTYRQTGYLGDGFGRGTSPAFYSVTSEPLLHEDWAMQAKGLWHEIHPWSEAYSATEAGLAQAEADLAAFEMTGRAPNGTAGGGPNAGRYRIHYSAITLNLYNVGDQHLLDVRFPIVMDSPFHQDMDQYAYWTNHPECTTRTWVEEVSNPPVEGTQRWFHVEFNLVGL